MKVRKSMPQEPCTPRPCFGDSQFPDAVSPVVIPLAEERPTLPLWPDTGRALDLSRSSTYEAARRGEIPTIRFGRRLVVPTVALRRMLALDS